MSFLSRQQKKEEGFYLNILSGKKNKERAGPYPKESPRRFQRRIPTSINITPTPRTEESQEARTSGTQNVTTEAGTSEVRSNIGEEAEHDETGALHDSSRKRKSREDDDDGIFN